jgi:hypothetical protein
LASLAEIDATEVRVAKAARLTVEFTGAISVRWNYLLCAGHAF